MYSPRHFLCVLFLIIKCTVFELLYPIVVAAAASDVYLILASSLPISQIRQGRLFDLSVFFLRCQELQIIGIVIFWFKINVVHLQCSEGPKSCLSRDTVLRSSFIHCVVLGGIPRQRHDESKDSSSST